MKKILTTLAFAAAFGPLTHAQPLSANIPLQAKVSFQPDAENMNGCVLQADHAGHDLDGNGLAVHFNLNQLREEEDVKIYLDSTQMPDVRIMFTDMELVKQLLDGSNTEPTQMNAVMMLNGFSVNCMFDVTKKPVVNGQLVCDLNCSLPYRNFGYSTEGLLRLNITINVFVQ